MRLELHSGENDGGTFGSTTAAAPRNRRILRDGLDRRQNKGARQSAENHTPAHQITQPLPPSA